MHSVERHPDRPQPAPPTAVQELARIADALEHLVTILDAFAGSLLNGKFRYGQPTDRWRRGA